jgi:hypothetical protein
VAPAYTVTLEYPALWYGSVNMDRYSGIACPDDYGPAYFEAALDGSLLPYTGYRFVGSQITFNCYEWTSRFYDSHVVFDLSSIKGQVLSAILRWKFEGSAAAGGGVGGLGYGCWIPLTDQNGAIIADYPLNGSAGYDVTTQVRAWVQGLPNKGFNLPSGVRDIVKAKNEQCQSRFGDFALEVSYAPGAP